MSKFIHDVFVFTGEFKAFFFLSLYFICYRQDAHISAVSIIIRIQ